MALKYNPKVSIIIPSYNSAKYIKSSIESVNNQTYKNTEIIVVDDGSNDGTKNIVKKLNGKIVYIEKEHSGISHTVNIGIKRSVGELLSFLDADDLWHTQKLEKQIDYLINNPDLNMVFCRVLNFNIMETYENIKYDGNDENGMTGYSRNTILIRKKDFLKVGYFSEKYKTGEFIDWYLRAQNMNFTSYVIPEILAKRRVHATNTTSNRDQLKSDYIQILKKSIDQKRSKS